MGIKASSTLPLPVKDVRAASVVVLRDQRQRLDSRLREVVETINEANARDNAGFWHRLFRCKDAPMLEIEPTIERWKESGVGSNYHPAYWLLERRRSWWWKRLEQFVLLPKSDDDLIMMVSVEDLDLIEYNAWKEAQ